MVFLASHIHKCQRVIEKIKQNALNLLGVELLVLKFIFSPRGLASFRLRVRMANPARIVEWQILQGLSKRHYVQDVGTIINDLNLTEANG